MLLRYASSLKSPSPFPLTRWSHWSISNLDEEVWFRVCLRTLLTPRVLFEINHPGDGISCVAYLHNRRLYLNNEVEPFKRWAVEAVRVLLPDAEVLE